MPITADDIWDQFLLEERAADLDPSIKHEWLDVLNQDLYRAMFTSDPEPYISESTITIISGTTAYNLPDDFEEIIPNYCGLFLYDDDGIQTDELHFKPKGSAQDGFYLNNVTGVLTITGSPSEDDWTLRYIPRIDPIENDEDELIIPERLKYKCKRIFFHSLSEMYKSYLERGVGDIQPDQIYKKSYYDSFVKLFEPNVKTITMNVFDPYYDSRISRRNFNRNR